MAYVLVRSRRAFRGLAGALAIATLFAVSYAAAAPGDGVNRIDEHHGLNGEIDVAACSQRPIESLAHCYARIRTDDLARSITALGPFHASATATIGNGGGYDPAYLRAAYNTPSLTAGAGKTVAIVDAYDDPTAISDLNYYRSNFGLPACTTVSSTGCTFTNGATVRKVDQNGGTSYPASDSGWALEIALDLDMVSALCPSCNILLVEAKSNATSDLGTSVNRAVTMGANVVSNSYGGGESSTETLWSSTYFYHPGIPITVSSGDSGYGVEYPAASQYVTSVGGTTLNQTGTSGRNATETAWSGAGSGCSSYEPKPSWQKDASCAKRMVADVSAVADPNTPVWVRNNNSWSFVGGTSVAAPLVAAIYALAGNSGPTDLPAKYPYGNTSFLNDVVSGSNGPCLLVAAYYCNAQAGYDGPTGLGTPNTAAAFAPAGPPPPPVKPGAPQSLRAAAGNAQVALTWSPPSSDGGSAVTSYNVYRGTASGAESLLATGVTSLGYTDAAVTNGTPYYYEVTALNSVGEGPASAEASATPGIAPGAPTNLAATAALLGGINLSWTAPAANGGPAVTGYRVYRGTAAGAESFLVAVSCTADVCSYKDSSTAHLGTYYYKVSAVNTAGEGAKSNEASAMSR
jgi:subtilase family serine protease